MATQGRRTPTAVKRERTTTSPVADDRPAPGPAPGPPRPRAGRPAGGGRPPAADPRSVESRLFEEGYRFDFFQAVRLLHTLDAGRAAVGRAGPPGAEAIRFRAHTSLSFPPSAI